MGITKRLNWQNIFVFLFLVLFPFGQIIRIGIFQPIDFIVGLAAVYTIVKRLKFPKVYKSLGIFVFFASFSWFFSIFLFHQIEILYGFLYLVRLTAYYFFGVYVWNFAKETNQNKKLLIDSLLAVSVFSSLFGWIQFFTFPDLKFLTFLGWDMHLFRLVGTFLDPTFLGLIIVFGLILSLYRYLDNRNVKNIAITVFLFISLAYTYSRASYLAFAAGVAALIYFEKRFRKSLLLIVGLFVVVLLLPTAKNHSIELFRTLSAIARVDNYKTTLQIFSKSPVFGIGYNNMCIAYQKYIGVQSFTSHSCSGSDSSLLFVLTTTGVVGFMILVYSIRKVNRYLSQDKYFTILHSCFVALLVHSLFSNSVFYSWILGYLVIFLAISLKEQS